MIQTLVVLGGGSAGFLAAITCKKKLPQLRVRLIRSPGIGVIGVGEGTTPVVPTHLHGYLDLDPGEFYRLAEPTWKLGVRFLWGQRPYFNYTFTYQFQTQLKNLSRPNGFYCRDDCRFADHASALMDADRAFLRQQNGAPLVGRDVAYHLENKQLVSYLETVASQVDVEVIDDTVVDVAQGEAGVEHLQLEEHGAVTADLYVDASGFRSLLLGDRLKEPYISYADSLYCDSAVVGGWQRSEEPVKPYTTVETMDAGWCWQIEHEHRINRGYVYSSNFISDEDAEREYRSLNPLVEQTRVVRFRSGRMARNWVKNVIGIGNAAGFVEPLESTSLGVICDDAQALSAMLVDCDCQPTPAMADQYNDRCGRIWNSIRNFLAIHYRFNHRRSTPFWQACNADVALHGAQRIVDYFLAHGPSTLWRDISIDPVDQFRLEGYLSLLIGQQVPYPQRSIGESEMATWQAHCQQMAQLAGNGFSVTAALAIIRSPQWSWTPGFYA